MTSADRSRNNRRLDLKTADREKSLSPFDKDELKLRCLERVRNERQRLMSRLRGRRGSPDGTPPLSSDLATLLETQTKRNTELNTEDALGNSARTLSSARQILRYGLSDIQASSGRRAYNQRYTDDPRRKLVPGATDQEASRSKDSAESPRPLTAGADGAPGGEMEMAEEHAYRTACSPAVGAGAQTLERRSGPGSGGNVEDGQIQRNRSGALELHSKGSGRSNVDNDGGMAMERDGEEGKRRNYPGDVLFEEPFDEEHLLSPEEYVEMMRYIEDACREEDVRAEAEVLREYEMNRRLEEDAVESAVASNLDMDGRGQDGVLCPVCKRDYLLQAGHPSAVIVCACGFRLDTCGDRLRLENVREQLAETYTEHG